LLKKRTAPSLFTFTIFMISCMRIAGNTAMQQFHFTGAAQGTTYAVTVYSEKERVRPSSIDSIFNRLDQSLSVYQPQSLISQFNASTKGIALDMHLKKVVQKSLEIFMETDGTFDITVSPLVQAWGFGPGKMSALPDSAYIQSLLPCVGSQKIFLVKNQLIKQNPCTKIDVNGIAQGYSVDVVAAFLEKRGIQDYLVEVGGEIRVKGKKYPDHEPFSIGIEAPSENAFSQDGIRKVISLENGAVTTSGSYRKFRQSGAKQISHIIDPKSGFPVQTEIVSVTVYGKDAITADGYDNALLAMGLQKSLAFLDKHQDLQAFFIYKKPDGTLADTATIRFIKFFR
jgi:thiamine biosynthesis lipoprotein